MTNALSNISVVICAYTEKRWDDLVAAVASVQQQTLSAREIVVVVDHNSTLLEKASEVLSGVVLVENLSSAGVNGSRNVGAAVTTAPIIAFLDDDAVASPEWLQHLLPCFEDPQVLGVGGFIEPEWFDGRPRWFPEEFYWVVGCSYRGMPQKAKEVRNLIGCNMAIRRVVWEEIGGFWCQFGHVGGQPRGCGDTEFGIRIHKHWPEHVLMYTPYAKVQHHVPASRIRWSYFLSRCKFEGQSKALLSKAVGAHDGLSSERNYTLWTLPQGVLRGIRESISKRNMIGFMRAGAILMGLTMTILGYVSVLIPSYTKVTVPKGALKDVIQQAVHL